MGAGFVFMMWLIPACGVAGVASWLLRMWVNEADLPEAKPRRAVFIAAIFPWACIAWGLWVCAIWSGIDASSGRDIGYGDDFHCPLPNGYELRMIDDLDWAWLREVKSVDDALDGIRTLQVAGPYFAGATSADDRFSATATVDSWFLLDTRTRQTTRFTSEADLRAAAGFKLELEPVSRIYADHRWTPFDSAMKYVLFIPPQIAFGLLLWWLKRLRQDARLALAAEEALEPAEEAAAAG